MRVDNTLLREELERRKISYAELARRLGWTKKKWCTCTYKTCGEDEEVKRYYYWQERPEDTRVGRHLGTYGTWSVKDGKRYGPYFQKTIDYDLAVKMCRVADIDPVEVGL